MQGRFSETDVLIVGAGPTGLMAALELASRGLSLRIIDKAPGRSDKSRALAVQARSLEMLQKHGLADRLIESGQKAVHAQFIVGGGRKYDIDLGDIGVEDSPYPFVLFVSQAETENVIEASVEELDQHVEWSVELVASLDTGDDIVATLRHEDGREEKVRTRYLLGCDGAHSAVRRAAGIAFEGAPYHQDFLLADVDVCWKDQVRHDSLELVLPSRGVLAVFPFKEHPLCRIIVAGAQLHLPEDHDPTLEEMQTLFDRMSPAPAQLRNPRWLSRFRLHHRVAEHYRRGRIFLVGDAAHIHSPAGGQGMNTGLQDAANLCWKLALVLRGRAPDRLLDSYEQERRPVGQKLLRYTDRLFSVASSSSPVISGVRNLLISTLVPRLASSPGGRARLFRFASQLGIRYAESPVGGRRPERSIGRISARSGQGSPSPGWSAHAPRARVRHLVLAPHRPSPPPPAFRRAIVVHAAGLRVVQGRFAYRAERALSRARHSGARSSRFRAARARRLHRYLRASAPSLRDHPKRPLPRQARRLHCLPLRERERRRPRQVPR